MSPTISTERDTLAVVFADIESYSAISEENETAAIEMVAKFRNVMTEQAKHHSGDILNFYGDGCLVVFESSVKAVEFAVEAQRAFRRSLIVPVRLGIHLGEVVRREGTVYGSTVNIASRLHDIGPAGSILVSETVAQQLSAQNKFKVVNLGREYVKNIKLPIKVYTIDSEGLVVPSWSDIHKRNSFKKRSSVIGLAILLAIVLVAAISAWFNRSRIPSSIRDQRLIVMPFQNNSNDSQLDELGLITSRQIAMQLAFVEGVKIVPFDDLLKETSGEEFNIISIDRWMNRTRAQNYVSGSLRRIGKDSIHIASALYNRENEIPLIEFPVVRTSLTNFKMAVEDLSVRVAGYWYGGGRKSLHMPDIKAQGLYLEALRYWKKDYDRAISLLKRAIAKDSTFYDAYEALFSAHYNQFDHELSDSTLTVIRSKFPEEDLTEYQLADVRYREALMKGDNELAHHLLRSAYYRDPAELFSNTTMAMSSLHFVNDPELCLSILNTVPFDSIDFEYNHHFRDRISLAIQAQVMLGNYRDAEKYVSYYPSDDNYRIHTELKLRSYAALGDTVSIDKCLRTVELTRDVDELRAVLFQLVKDLELLGKYNLRRKYLSQAITLFAKEPSLNYGELLYMNEQYDSARVIFENYIEYYPNHPLSISALARFDAATGNWNSAEKLLIKLDEIKPQKYDFGETEYMQCQIFTLAGKYSDALIKLQQSIDNGLYFTYRYVENDPILKPLFELPEFQRIVHPLED